MTRYDAIVIGSGQAGNPLAHKLADEGWRVALVERSHLGGTCVNHGCTPTKTMVASARAAHTARRAGDFGVTTGEVKVDLAQVVARKDEVVRQWREGQEEQVEKRPSLDLYRGHGRFTEPHVVSVEGELLKSDHIFINTGARPRLPDLEGGKAVDMLTNRSILDLTELPEHLVVLGGSYVGLEFGQMFARFGSRVTVIERHDRIVHREDADVSEALRGALEAEGLEFRTRSTATGVVPERQGFKLTVDRGERGQETVRGTHLLSAVGRVPNTDDLGLDAAGIEVDEGGHVRTNDRLETNVEGIWALGDVKGGPAFTHISYDDHLVVYENLVGHGGRSIDGRIVPYAVYTDPELGRAGLTERQARDAGLSVKVGSLPMSKVARAIERDETAGLMKVVIDRESRRIVGAAVLGPEGGELIHILLTAMRAELPWTVFRHAVYIHPTLAEGLFGLMEAVGDGADDT